MIKILTSALYWAQTALKVGGWIKERVVERWGRISPQSVDKHIDIVIRLEAEDSVDIVVRTFTRNPDKTDKYERWMRYKDLFPQLQGETYRISKDEISKSLPHKSYPYKAFLRVPDKSTTKRKYYVRLCAADLVVTGKGDPDPDQQDKWRIWFLFPREPYHPVVPQLWYMNNKL